MLDREADRLDPSAANDTMSDNRHLVSRNVAAIELSAIKDMAMRGAATPGAVSLAWGLPSFRTPEHIRNAAMQALETDPDAGKYALPDGLPELREAAARRHRERTGVTVDPDREVVITAGNMQGLNALFHVLLDPGDEVVVTDPGFASHFQQIRLCGGTPVHWSLDRERGWALDAERLRDLITPRTKAVVLVTPSNPTGTVFPEPDLRAVGEIVRRAGVALLLDDPYSHFVYGAGAGAFNLARDPDLRDRTAYLFTFSKAYAMSGWRLAYAVVPASLKAEILKVHDATVICAPRISQIAGVAALGGDYSHLETFRHALARRRDLICERLDRVAHVFDYVRPDGAYYAFPRILVAHENSVEFARRLLAETGVTVTPGRAFGPSGEHHVRMAFCVDETAINDAFDRIETRYPH